MTTHFPHDDEPLAARLRDALSAEADMVNPSEDGLQDIRSSVEAGRRPWWRHPAALSVAAAVVLGLLVGGGLALTGGDGDSNTVVADDPTETPTPTPTPSESESAPSPTPSPAQDVWVYYVLDDPAAGPRLYREQHTAESGDEAPVVALRDMLGEPASDPDYSSPWPEGTEVLDYSVDGATAAVDLSRFPSVGSEFEGLAVQQLVHTVTANDTSVKQVRLLVEGTAPEGAFDWSQPVKRSAALDVQGLVWLLEPRQDAEVGSPVEIVGYGTAFEGTVSWEVRKQGSDRVVAEGFAQAGSNGDFGDFTDSVELAPGTYEIRAFESSAEDGRPLHVDDKVFTVR